MRRLTLHPPTAMDTERKNGHRRMVQKSATLPSMHRQTEQTSTGMKYRQAITRSGCLKKYDNFLYRLKK